MCFIWESRTWEVFTIMCNTVMWQNTIIIEIETSVMLFPVIVNNHDSVLLLLPCLYHRDTPFRSETENSYVTILCM